MRRIRDQLVAPAFRDVPQLENWILDLAIFRAIKDTEGVLGELGDPRVDELGPTVQKSGCGAADRVPLDLSYSGCFYGSS